MQGVGKEHYVLGKYAYSDRNKATAPPNSHCHYHGFQKETSL